MRARLPPTKAHVDASDDDGIACPPSKTKKVPMIFFHRDFFSEVVFNISPYYTQYYNYEKWFHTFFTGSIVSLLVPDFLYWFHTFLTSGHKVKCPFVKNSESNFVDFTGFSRFLKTT